MSRGTMKGYRFTTRAVHAGNAVDKETGAIKRPITMANSYQLSYDPSSLNWSDAGENLYDRLDAVTSKHDSQNNCSELFLFHIIPPFCLDCIPEYITEGLIYSNGPSGC